MVCLPGDCSPRIRFWHDRWIGDATLKVLYPELYECSAVKDACISEVLWIPEGGTVRVWNLTFYRAFEDWEMAASYSLLRLIQSRIPQGSRRDTLYWRLKGMVCLTLGLTTSGSEVLRILGFLGRGFGNRRSPSVWLSFCGLLLMVGSSPWTTLCLRVGLWLIGVACAARMGSRLTIFFCIVLLPIPFGLACFRPLGFFGLCQVRWQS